MVDLTDEKDRMNNGNGSSCGYVNVGRRSEFGWHRFLSNQSINQSNQTIL